MDILILSRNKNIYSTNRLSEVGLKRGHRIKVIDYMRCYMNINSVKPAIYFGEKLINRVDAVIPRIGASVTSYGTAVVRQLEMMNCYCFNSANAILNSRDKLKSLQILASKGISLPNTGFANHTKDIQTVIENFDSVPLVVKLLHGTQGQGVILAETAKAAADIMNAFRQLNTEIMVQEFIKESAGTDIRAFVVGNKVIAAMRRIAPEGEFRSNVHQGGETVVVELTAKEIEVAIKAVKIFNLSIAGVDIMRSNRGPLVVEVNSSPGLQGIENCSGVDVATEIYKHIEEVISNNIQI